MSVRRGKADIAQEHAKGRFWREAVNEIQMEQFDFRTSQADAAMSAPRREADEGRALFDYCFLTRNGHFFADRFAWRLGVFALSILFPPVRLG
jgi:hypothetical protein